MKSRTAIFVTLLSSASFLADASPGRKFTTTDTMMYTGPVTPGGVNVTLEGTAQQIYYQILKLNPDYHPEAFSAVPNASALNASSMLEKRGRSHIICDPSGTLRAWRGHIEHGIAFLRRIPQGGDCSVKGHRSCARISCSYDSGIFLCNDNPYWIERPCHLLGDYAEAILNRCQASVPKVSGQQFDTDNFNVLVKYDKC
ncbi:hypothetical protein FQN49_005076 [Arthroderma sp. PD_2]|nr:hypothetical protein FQN49_005076 [Arthroderma sp. PD_2]